MFNLELVNKGNKVVTKEGKEVENLVVFKTNPPMVVGVINKILHIWNEEGRIVDFLCTQSSYMQLEVTAVGMLFGTPMYVGDTVYIKGIADFYTKGCIAGEYDIKTRTMPIAINGTTLYVKPEDLRWNPPTKKKVKVWKWAVVHKLNGCFAVSDEFHTQQQALSKYGAYYDIEKIDLSEKAIEVEL